MINETLQSRYYITQKIGEGSTNTVYKANDIKEDREIVLKIPKEGIRTKDLSGITMFSEKMRQFTSLRSAHIVNIYDIFHHQNFPVLVTEYIEGQTLLEYLESVHKVDIDKMVEVVIEVLKGLEFIHMHGIIHRDIKPSNIMVLAESSQAKITDFGLALLLDLSQMDKNFQVAGTLSYMSPEQTGMLKKPLDGRSDIYSLGIMFYQLLTLKLPIQAEDIPTLIHKHIAVMPKEPSALNKDISPVLDKIILTMIAKDPKDRYQTEKGIIADLEEYLAKRRGGQTKVNFEIGRRDKLTKLTYQSHVVGREKETRLLHSLVDRLKIINGGTVFLKGKAGTGKTRLMNELRSYAYAQNAIFVSGKCYKSSVKTPYYVLREFFDDYIDRIQRLPHDLKEERISLMKQLLGQLGKEVTRITPKIEELLGEQPELVELEAQKEKRRFLMTVSNFLVGSATPKNPLIVFLDDLQWVDEASLEVVLETIERVKNSSVLICSAFREEEVIEDHPVKKMIDTLEQQALDLEFLHLDNLNEEETNLVISEILTEEAEGVKDLSKHIYNHTKGNPLFVMELLRVLIDSKAVFFRDGRYTCSFEELDSLGLPSNVIDLLILRIESLGDTTSTILSYAAALGKKFFFKDLISLLSFMEVKSILAAMQEAEDNQFLTRSFSMGEEEIFFIHDRIRETFYQKLPQQFRIEINKKIAFSLEEAHKDNPDPVVFDLAHHFREAEITEKAVHYSYLAAKKAQRTYAYQEALSFYNYVKDILDKGGNQNVPQYMDSLEKMGELYRLTGKFDLSKQFLQESLKFITEKDKLHKAEIYFEIGDTLREAGETEESTRWFESGFEILHIRQPSKPWEVGLFIMAGFFIQFLHVLFPGIFIARSRIDNPKKILLSRGFPRVARNYYFFDMNKTFLAFLRALNVSEAVGPSMELSRTYTYGGAVWVTFPLFKRALRDLHKGIEMAKQLNDRVREGTGYAYNCLVLNLMNKPKESIEVGRKAISTLKELGEYWDVGVACAFINHSLRYLGQFRQCVIDAERFSLVARRAKSMQTLSWHLGDLGYALALTGDKEGKAVSYIEEARELSKQVKDKPNVVYFSYYLAHVHLLKKNYHKAIEAIEEAMELFPTHNNKAAWLYELFPVGAQVYLEAIINLHGLAEKTKKNYFERAKWFCKQAFKLAKKYSFFLSSTLRVYANYLYLKGNKNKANKYFQQAIRVSQQDGHMYQVGLCFFELGRFLLQEKDEKLKEKAQNYLEQARQLFIKCEAKFDEENANNLLGIRTKEEDVSKEKDLSFSFAERGRILSLQEVSNLISSILELGPLLEKIVELSIKLSGAERGFLMLYNQNTGKLELSFSNIEKQIPKTKGLQDFNISKTIIAFVEEKKTGIVYPRIDTEEHVLNASDSIAFYGVRSILCTPLISKGKLLGMIYLDSHLAEGVFEEEDLGALTAICRQAAISIENARLYKESQEKVKLEQEMNTAKQIQMSLLPSFSPEAGDLKVEGLMLSAKQVAGDYYDFITYSPQRLGIVVADVSGKGLDAGMVMSMTKSTIMTLSRESIAPRNLVIELNKLLCKQLKQQKFISLIYAEYTTDDNTFTWAGAGHEHVLVYRASDSSSTGVPEVEIIKTGGIVLGMFDDIDDNITQQSVVLNKGDGIVLYTDGVTEARNPEKDMFSLEKLVETVRIAPANFSAKELLDYIKKTIQEFIQDAPQYDDITLVVLKRE